MSKLFSFLKPKKKSKLKSALQKRNDMLDDIHEFQSSGKPKKTAKDSFKNLRKNKRKRNELGY